MHFSVKNLLAVTLLAVLAVNGWNTKIKLVEMRRDKVRLKANLQSFRQATLNHDERVLIYDRAFEASQNRKREIGEYNDQLELLVDEISQLEIKDRAKVYLREIPTPEPESGYTKRFRIWLPESHEFYLHLHSEVFSLASGKSPKEGRFFHPPKSKMFPIGSGESVIEVKWIEEPELTRVQLYMNEKLVHEATSPLSLPNGTPFGRVRAAQTEWKVESIFLVGNSYEPGELHGPSDEMMVLLHVAEQ